MLGENVRLDLSLSLLLRLLTVIYNSDCIFSSTSFATSSAPCRQSLLTSVEKRGGF